MKVIEMSIIIMASMSNGENGGINNVSAWRNVIAKIININNGVIYQ
jgi:hypothetical protein